FPRVREAPAVPESVPPKIATHDRTAQSVDAPHAIDTPHAAGRLSIVTDPADARVEVDGRSRGTSPVVIDGLAAGEHHITVTSDSGASKRTITVSNGVMTEVVFSLPRTTAATTTTAPLAGWIAIGSPFPVELLEHDELVGASGTAKIMLAA